MIDVAIIVGSTRPGRRAEVVARWIFEIARKRSDARFELVDIAGLTAQAAADTLGCPRGTVLARVHRGRRRLAAALEAEGVRDDV